MAEDYAEALKHVAVLRIHKILLIYMYTYIKVKVSNNRPKWPKEFRVG
jgi:hypothetical protein